MKYTVIFTSIAIILQAIEAERMQERQVRTREGDVGRSGPSSGLDDEVVERLRQNRQTQSRIRRTSNEVRQVSRPVDDCSFCEGVQQVDRISGVDPKLFEERYAYSGHPVVITDAASNWTATEKFSFVFLKELYEDREADCQFFGYDTEFRSLQEVFNMSMERALLQTGTKPWYIGWSNCDDSIRDALRQLYQRPYFLPDDAEEEETDWLFMGSPGYGAPMHIDNVEYPSWQAQIRGSKTWTLEPPRECQLTCRRLEVTVNPGEIIVLDTNKWYHQTMIVSEDISITIGAEYSRTCSIRESPLPESDQSREFARARASEDLKTTQARELPQSRERTLEFEDSEIVRSRELSRSSEFEPSETTRTRELTRSRELSRSREFESSETTRTRELSRSRECESSEITRSRQLTRSREWSRSREFEPSENSRTREVTRSRESSLSRKSPRSREFYSY